MKSRMLLSILGTGLTVCAFSSGAIAQDVDAAKELMKQNKCSKCHATDKEKDGPSYKQTAAKYKGKADAEAKLSEFLLSGKAPSGGEEHTPVKTTPPNDKAQVTNLVKYILSL
jgi:cytochrome c